MNPQNSQELVYIRQNGYVHQVFYFNRHTQTHRLLQEGHFDAEPVSYTHLTLPTKP
jgi:hypothetical protein